MLFIFFMSSIPASDLENAEGLRILMNLKPEIQNILHIPLYAILTVLWYHALQNRDSSSKALLVSCLISGTYGIMDEVHQYFVPGRYLSVLDMGLNIVGCGLTVLFLNAKFYRDKQALF